MLHPSYCSDVVDVRHHILEGQSVLQLLTMLSTAFFVNLHGSVPGRVVVCEEVGEEVDHDNATLLSHHL